MQFLVFPINRAKYTKTIKLILDQTPELLFDISMADNW